MQVMHIITPVTTRLETVNLIARGLDNIPSALLGFEAAGGMYSTFMFAEGIGANASRNRHIQRRPQ